MNIHELNKMIASLNPFDADDKELLKFYISARRKLQKQLQRNIDDIINDHNLPEMLKRQSGL